jgi:hypothetical protein
MRSDILAAVTAKIIISAGEWRQVFNFMFTVSDEFIASIFYHEDGIRLLRIFLPD